MSSCQITLRKPAKVTLPSCARQRILLIVLLILLYSSLFKFSLILLPILQQSVKYFFLMPSIGIGRLRIDLRCKCVFLHFLLLVLLLLVHMLLFALQVFVHHVLVPLRILYRGVSGTRRIGARHG